VMISEPLGNEKVTSNNQESSNIPSQKQEAMDLEKSNQTNIHHEVEIPSEIPRLKEVLSEQRKEGNSHTTSKYRRNDRHEIILTNEVLNLQLAKLTDATVLKIYLELNKTSNKTLKMLEKVMNSSKKVRKITFDYPK